MIVEGEEYPRQKKQHQDVLGEQSEKDFRIGVVDHGDQKQRFLSRCTPGTFLFKQFNVRILINFWHRICFKDIINY